MKLRRIALALFLAASPILVHAQAGTPVTPVPAEEDALARKMLELTGSLKLGNQIVSSMYERMAEGKSEREQELLKRFAAKIDMRDLETQMIRLYSDHFTADDLRGLVAFYESETGRKYIAAMPTLLKESMEIGRIWAQVKMQELATELERELAQPTTL